MIDCGSAGGFERQLNASEVFLLHKEVADQIARTQPYGVIHSDPADDAEAKPPEHLSSHDCVMQFYRYWRTFDPSIAADLGSATRCWASGRRPFRSLCREVTG